MMNVKAITQKRAMLDVMEELTRVLDREREYISTDYKKVGYYDDEYQTDRDGNIKYDDDGNPIHKEKWDNVDKAKEDYTESDLAKLQAIDKIEAALEKLI